MAGELGLINSYRRLINDPLTQYRNPKDDKESRRDIDLETFCREKSIKNAAGKPMTVDDVWNDLGMDPRRTTLSNIISLSDDIKYWAPEVVRTYINKGLRAKPWFDKLCAGQVDVGGMQVVSPWVVYDNEGMEITGEAETIAHATLEWGYKWITLKKKAKSINYSDEVMFGCVLPQVAPFLERIGNMLAASLNRDAVETLVNGDLPSGDECAVIGTKAVGVRNGNSLCFSDFMRAWVRADMLYYEWDSLIGNEEMVLAVLNIPEFTRPQGFGTELVRLSLQDKIMPDESPLFSSSAMPPNQVLMFDKSSALLHLTFLPLRIESERIVSRQINGTFASIIDGFTTIDRRARIIMDSSVEWVKDTATDFPGFMTPLN